MIRSNNFSPRVSFFAVFFSIVGLLLATGCGRENGQKGDGKAPVTEPATGGMAVVALAGDPDVLNPLIRRSTTAGLVLAEILDTLTELDEDLNYVPRIARRWELAEDGLSIRYHLAPWNWEDGQALTARDVVRSFELFKNPDVGARSRGFFRDVVSATASGDSTVVYRFSRRLPDPLGRTAHAILPWHIVKDLDPAAVDRWPLNQEPLASGPFALESWDYSHALVLARNSLYSGIPARLDRVMFRIIKEPAARILALEAGEVDFVGDIPAHDAARLEQNPGIELNKTEGRRFYYLQWNCRNPRLADAATRRALSLALDRERMIETLLGGYALPAVSPIARVLWNHADHLLPDPYDPATARQMLREAGWEAGEAGGVLRRDGVPLELEILTRTGDPVRRDGAVIIRENLEAVGVSVQVRAMELAAGLDLVNAGRFDVYFGAMTPNLYGDPSSAVHSGAIDEYNSGFYSNTRVDSLLAKALGITDRETARPYWNELQEVLQEDSPAAYLFCPQRLDAVSHRIRDVRPHVLSPVNNLSEWWIAPEDRKYRTRESPR